MLDGWVEVKAHKGGGGEKKVQIVEDDELLVY